MATHNDALAKAREIFDRLVSGNKEMIDFYYTFDEFEARERWGEHAPAVLAASGEGRRLIEDAMAVIQLELAPS
ncbi:MAG: hypothetical protein HY329_24035 [Chloroflexi bacterium]|nr:hypothetical protein [Chloroflexota bacterium]